MQKLLWEERTERNKILVLLILVSIVIWRKCTSFMFKTKCIKKVFGIDTDFFVWRHEPWYSRWWQCIHRRFFRMQFHFLAESSRMLGITQISCYYHVVNLEEGPPNRQIRRKEMGGHKEQKNLRRILWTNTNYFKMCPICKTFGGWLPGRIVFHLHFIFILGQPKKQLFLKE